MTKTEFRRYALFYFAYFGALGAYTPYVGRWIESQGYGAYVIGTMLALWYGGRVVAPPLWSRFTARSPAPGHWLLGGCLLALLGFATFGMRGPLPMLFTAMAWFGLFFNAVMPQFEAMTLSALGNNNHDYGRIRMWGSIGFLMVAGTYGWLLDRLGDEAFVWLTLPWLALAVVAAWLHRRDLPHAEINREAGAALWKRTGVRRLLGVALMMQLGFGPFYVFYTLHMQAHGHNGTAVGALWAFGVLCEIGMFWHMPKLIQRLGAYRLMSLCLLISTLRWMVVAVAADSFVWMLAMQSVHALTFAAFHAACMQRMSEIFPVRRDMVGAQGMLYGISGGIGGVLGAGMAAFAWQHGGGRAAFFAGAAATLAALALHLSAARFARTAAAT